MGSTANALMGTLTILLEEHASRNQKKLGMSVTLEIQQRV
jgi:hypothetical protein